MINLYEIAKKESERAERVGNSRNGLIDTNAYIFHVIQQTYNREKFFSADVARHRDALFKAECAINGVITIANVIMPTHTHDIVLTSDFSALQKTIRCTNAGVSKFIRQRLKANNWKARQQIFAKNPGYVSVKSRLQLFILIKYLYDNPAYLKQNDEFVPYSCFDAWEKNNFKPYNKNIVEQILGLTTSKLLEHCKTLNQVEFVGLANKLFGNDSTEYNRQLFCKNK